MAGTALERFTERLAGEVEAQRREGRYYTPNIISSAQGPRITMDGRAYVNLCANNYRLRARPGHHRRRPRRAGPLRLRPRRWACRLLDEIIKSSERRLAA